MNFLGQGFDSTNAIVAQGQWPTTGDPQATLVRGRSKGVTVQ